MVTADTPVEQPAAAQKLVPVEFELRLTLVAAATGEALPNTSCDCTVAVAEQLPAVSVCAALVMTSFEGADGFTVCVCVAGVRPLAVAVSVGLPERVSFQ